MVIIDDLYFRISWRVSTSLKGGQFGRLQWDSLKNKNRWNIHIQTTPLNSHARQRRGRRDWNISLSSTIFFRHDLSTFTGRERFFGFKKKMLPSTLDKKIDYKKQVTFLSIRNIHSCYFLQLSRETWRPWVKQSDQSKPLTQTKNQQTTKKSKVYIIRPPFPPPQMKKNIACWRKVENAIFLQSRKNNTTPPPKKKITP